MIRSRILMTFCALTAATAAPAAEVEGDLTCHRGSTSGYRSCYDPCEPVGPIRALFRALFRTPCPRPAPPIMVPVPVASARPPIADWCPPSPPAPPATIAPPTRVHPPLDVPSPPAPVSGFGARPPRLTPPTPPPPVPLRYDRLASRGDGGPEVTLVHATRTGLKLVALPDRDGSLTRDLVPGLWLVYTKGADGKLTFRNKVTSHEGVATRITLD